jgi:hypothetical protein
MDTIQQVLGDQYAMFYHGGINSDQLVPLQTLSQCIADANQGLNIHGRDLNNWPDQYATKISKLVRAHAIYHRLAIEPIRKPILVHKENTQFIVDCGDTRLMALNQLPNPTPVSVIVTCRTNAVDQYQHWTRIYNTADLSECTGFVLNSNRVKAATVSSQCDYALCWLEIGDASTSHHLHDPQQRLHMMQKYLDQQSADFQFDNAWLLKEINW